MSDNSNPNQQANQTGVPSPAPARVAQPGATAPAAAPRGGIDEDAWNAIKNEWLNNNMRNSPVANNAESWNHLVSQLDALRTIVAKHL
jgi:hypothetical protein